MRAVQSFFRVAGIAAIFALLILGPAPTRVADKSYRCEAGGGCTVSGVGFGGLVGCQPVVAVPACGGAVVVACGGVVVACGGCGGGSCGGGCGGCS